MSWPETFDRVEDVRRVVASLPSTSEREFSSGAPRFFVADKPFAHLTPDLQRLVVRISEADWYALGTAEEDLLRPEPPASPRQRWPVRQPGPVDGVAERGRLCVDGCVVRVRSRVFAANGPTPVDLKTAR